MADPQRSRAHSQGQTNGANAFDSVTTAPPPVPDDVPRLPGIPAPPTPTPGSVVSAS
jgi:hypothetical protein